MPKDIPVVLIIGKQNVGKTTLIGLIIPRLKKRGYRVGTIKYNIPHFEIDHEGKDTYRHYQAGADIVSISSAKKLAIIKRVGKRSPAIKDIIRDNYQDADIVLVEGYKKWKQPCIEIQNNCRQADSPNGERKSYLRINSFPQKDAPVPTPTFRKKDLSMVMKFIESNMKYIR